MKTSEVYVGLDLHKETIHGTALDKDGNTLCSYKFSNNAVALGEFFKSFQIWNTIVAIEACGMWRSCYIILRNMGFTVKLANAYKCHKIVSNKKTDEIDSRLLADLLRSNFLPEVYIPSDDSLKFRDLCRYRCNLVDERVRIQNQIKHCLLREGIAYKDIWNKKGINWLKSIGNNQLTNLTELYELFCVKEKSARNEISAIARGKKETSLLMSIPGIGVIGALMIYSEICDINRFPTLKKLHAYAGVAPGIYQSANTSINTPRNDVNKWLKWILTECAGISIRKPNKFQRHYFDVEKRKGWKIARKVVARDLLSVVWHILRKNVPYKES